MGDPDHQRQGSFADTDRVLITTYHDNAERVRVNGLGGVRRLLGRAELDAETTQRAGNELHLGHAVVAHPARKARAVVTRLLALAGLCAALAACGASGGEPRDAHPARTPAPAPQVALSVEERLVWAPRPVGDPAVLVLLYRDVAPEEFARQMILLHHAGYRTIGVDELARFVERKALVFTQDRKGFARPGAGNPIGRIEVSGDTTEAALLARLSNPRGSTDNTGG